MTTTITCTQCSQTFPGDETEIDEEQILVPERYSTIIGRTLTVRLMIRNQEGVSTPARATRNTYTWNSLLSIWEAHANKHKLPIVAGDVATFINRGHRGEATEQDVELGRASLSYVRAIDELRHEGTIAVLPDGKILYTPQEPSTPNKPKPHLRLV